ncbi:50S ribosomal protein L11 methyltransferase [bacterium]|nr:50S ribosomal protein L11 methyltransferase [bacterium]
MSVQLLLDRPAGLGHGRHMDWISRKLTLPPPLAPFIEERLVAAGWTSLSSERATGDRRVTLRVYVRPGEALPAPEDFAGWIAEAETAGLPGARLRFEDDEFDEQDWNAAFREHFVPREVIPGLTVVPPWNMTGPVHQRGEPMPGSNADLSLVIEPALAFGTGDHPTTQMCLEMLRDYAREREASGKPWDCLDIGSGTGILSIAAKLWGARRVEGFDIDKRSILNAYLNADLNGLAGDVRFRWGEPKDLGEKQWDIVVCNLFLTPIQKYLSQMAKAADPNGILVLSGFLDEQQEKVTDLACMKNLKLTITKQKDHWVSQLWVKTSN